MALVGKELNTPIPIHAHFALFGAVWAIYLVDHLNDTSSGKVTTERRRFHLKYAFLLRILIVISFIIGVTSAVFLHHHIILTGVMLGGICGMYLSLAQWLGKRWMKELAIAACYSLGVMLVPLATQPFEYSQASIFIQIFLLAFLNLITFSIYEENEDRKEGFPSIATEIGKEKSTRIAYLMICALIVSLSILRPFGPFSAFILVGTLIYAGMYIMPDFFSKKDRFRIWGDAVFLLAALFLLF